MAASIADYRAMDHSDCSVAGHRMHLVTCGDGPPVLAVHGSPTHSAIWRHAMTALARDHRCHAPDLLGFGSSSAPEEGASFLEQATVLRAWFDLQGWERFDLLVHDWGGPVALGALADRLDRVDRLVLVNTTFRPDFVPPPGWEAFTDPGSGEQLLVDGNAWCAGLPTAMTAAAQSTELHALYLQPSEQIGLRRTTLRMERLEGFAELLAPVPAALSARSGGTSIIWGEDDPYFGTEYLQLRAHLPGAELTMIPGGGHFPQEDQPDAVVAAIRRALDR